MREKPILFSAPMVRAILEDRKSVTRRVVKPRGVVGELRVRTARFANDVLGWEFGHDKTARGVGFSIMHCPYGAPGDRLWVRETWCPMDREGWWQMDAPADRLYDVGGIPRRNGVAYRTHRDADSERCRVELGYRWKPSIHMPRWASRISLEVTEVRVERLREISDTDALSEGVTEQVAGLDVDIDGYWWPGRPVARFRELWDGINAARGYGWDANPWVWVLRFKRVRP